MIIYPAIDIKDGKCVRLLQGRFEDVTVYGDMPSQMALQWKNGGAEYIHVVDLDGARQGNAGNAQAIMEIVKAAGDVPVQLGGGIRDLEKAHMALSLGVRRIIIGTAAVSNDDFLEKLISKYGNRIVIGIDAKDGFAATHGWEQVSDIRATELAKKACDLGAQTIIYTDIATDGMLTGPNVEAMAEMVACIHADVIASGGVSGMEDIEALKSTGVKGVIVGKALYSGRFTLSDAIRAGK